ncbi:Protein CBG26948 [Caenorhabditis briggsae]|uniref:Protein CBG26948 n=1 Tax=Caenorhabditis briggsae TaxID=6238 RepID=B6IHU1_CAEBR|nr:Protein CBG26948 [Caenorhabditis briggsae]CAR99471.1 Protein CBG26948 [Caenorhabditis briggsae]
MNSTCIPDIGYFDSPEFLSLVLHKNTIFPHQFTYSVSTDLENTSDYEISKTVSNEFPKVGQVVLINTNLVRCHKWPLGIITKVFHSKEGIRTAVVKCKGKLYERSVCHLIPLEIESVESQECTPDNVNTDEDPGYKSIPNPPLPAIFDIPQAEYVPKRFKDSKKNFVPSAGNLPTVGERDPEEEINYDTQHLDTEPVDGEYRDPNETAKQILDYGKNAVPDTRTREYLPRKAKAPYINYPYYVPKDFPTSKSVSHSIRNSDINALLLHCITCELCMDCSHDLLLQSSVHKFRSLFIIHAWGFVFNDHDLCTSPLSRYIVWFFKDTVAVMSKEHSLKQFFRHNRDVSVVVVAT